MQQEEITNYIVTELGKQRNPKDIAMAVCEKANMSWADAQKLVFEVRAGHREEIEARQNPIFIGFSVAFLILGIPFLCQGLWAVSQGIITRAAAITLILGVVLSIGGIRGLWDIINTFLKTK
jgi:hypothetical protein